MLAKVQPGAGTWAFSGRLLRNRRTGKSCHGLGGVVVVASGLWAVVTYVWPAQEPPNSGSRDDPPDHRLPAFDGGSGAAFHQFG
jgi:hypothetical protein